MKSTFHRRLLGDLLLFAGFYLVLLVGLIWLRSELAAERPVESRLLVSTIGSDPSLPAAINPPVENAQEPAPGPIPQLPPSPVIRLVIPLIAVDQSVVSLGVLPGSTGEPGWDTEALFATEGRTDLVGQMVTSLNPGEGGNIILVGHNYDRGRIKWDGVFKHLGDLKPGNQLILYNQNGEMFLYTVQSVEKIPWSEKNAAELKKHERFLWPTEKEQVTLVTCSGSTRMVWSSRIYVVAVPSSNIGQ
jgi:sortase A